jgi:hypothetical protein
MIYSIADTGAQAASQIRRRRLSDTGFSADTLHTTGTLVHPLKHRYIIALACIALQIEHRRYAASQVQHCRYTSQTASQIQHSPCSGHHIPCSGKFAARHAACARGGASRVVQVGRAVAQRRAYRRVTVTCCATDSGPRCDGWVEGAFQPLEYAI